MRKVLKGLESKTPDAKRMLAGLPDKNPGWTEAALQHALDHRDAGIGVHDHVGEAVLAQVAGQGLGHVRQGAGHRREPGRETSYGNAGLIQREAVAPYPFPRDWATLLRVALKRGADVSYHLGALPAVAHAANVRAHAAVISRDIFILCTFLLALSILYGCSTRDVRRCAVFHARPQITGKRLCVTQRMPLQHRRKCDTLPFHVS